jgi:hypothetical protein
LNPHSEQQSARKDLEKGGEVELLAYRLWLERRDRNISGDANCDYFQAERILASYKNLKRLLLGSFGFSAVAFVLGRSPEEHYANATKAVIELNELMEESDLSPKLWERLLRSDPLQLLSDRYSGATARSQTQNEETSLEFPVQA